jgi:hypothetical protein
MDDTNSADGPVTVVLVHGAFADGTGWAGVIERLQAADVPVRAVVNPLRGITTDSAYVASVFSQFRAGSWPSATPMAAPSLPTPPRTRATSSGSSTWPRLPLTRARLCKTSKQALPTAS